MTVSYFDDNEDHIIYGRSPRRGLRLTVTGKNDMNFDEDYEPEDRITCQRCGTQGLHWQQVTAADGKSEQPRLFNERNRPHQCSEPSADDFGVVK